MSGGEESHQLKRGLDIDHNGEVKRLDVFDARADHRIFLALPVATVVIANSDFLLAGPSLAKFQGSHKPPFVPAPQPQGVFDVQTW